jgi:hypothetical protein
MGGDIGQREHRRELRLERFLALEHLGVGLADHLDVAHRVLEAFHPEVEVVDPSVFWNSVGLGSTEIARTAALLWNM